MIDWTNTPYADRKDWTTTTYAERVLAALGALKWGLSDLAKKAGTTRGNVNHVQRAFDRGKDYHFKGPLSARVATALGVTHDWLALGIGEPQPALHMERAALSARAVYIGMRFDAVEGQAARDRAYALLIQLLDFPGGPHPHGSEAAVKPSDGLTRNR